MTTNDDGSNQTVPVLFGNPPIGRRTLEKGRGGAAAKRKSGEKFRWNCFVEFISLSISIIEIGIYLHSSMIRNESSSMHEYEFSFSFIDSDYIVSILILSLIWYIYSDRNSQ